MCMRITRQRTKVRRSPGFTLVELILVMTIMVIMIGMLAPSLKGFFRGRNLDNEALQFLALTRYGQSRAINEGVPVELWVNSTARTYGLEALSGYAETPGESKTFTLNSDLKITFLTAAATTTLQHSNYWSQTKAQIGAVTRIRFQPDGFISDASPKDIYLTQGADRKTIAEAPTHLEYDIQTGQLNGR